MAQAKTTPKLNIETVTEDVLATIERDREREIIARRFGLFDRKETLEQIGELLGITRERVRQLEKAVLAKLKASASNGLPHIQEVQPILVDQLKQMGNVARVSDLTSHLTKDNNRIDQSRVSFLARLCPKIAVIRPAISKAALSFICKRSIFLSAKPTQRISTIAW